MKNNLPLGRFGEELAAKYLQKNGYRILARNFRKGYGEIDIITQKEDTLVFVEVKTRIGDKYGKPEEAITPWKLKALIRTVQYYKVLHPKLPDSLRIDLLAIDLSPAGEVKTLKHLQNITS